MTIKSGSAATAALLLGAAAASLKGRDPEALYYGIGVKAISSGGRADREGTRMLLQEE